MSEFPTEPPDKELTYGDVEAEMKKFGNWTVLKWTPDYAREWQEDNRRHWEDAQARKLYNILGDGAT